MTKTFRAPLAGWVWHCSLSFVVFFGIAWLTVGAAVIGLESFADAPDFSPVQDILHLALGAPALALAILFTWIRKSGRLVLDDTGVRHESRLNSWSHDWDDIDDWSALEVWTSGGEGESAARTFFLRTKEQGIKRINEEFFARGDLMEIKNILKEKLHEPKDPQNPVLPDDWDIVETRPI